MRQAAVRVVREEASADAVGRVALGPTCSSAAPDDVETENLLGIELDVELDVLRHHLGGACVVDLRGWRAKACALRPIEGTPAAYASRLSRDDRRSVVATRCV